MPPVDSAAIEAAKELAEQGKKAFHKGDYARALYSFRHAVVDNPQDPKLLLLLAQALFANGKFDEAAGATQAALHQLPKADWGSVVEHYRQLYGRAEDYTAQLRVLEKAVNNKPEDPALRFLSGYHFAYLGFHKQAIDQFDRGLKLMPGDEIAKELREETSSRLLKMATPSKLDGPVLK